MRVLVSLCTAVALAGCSPHKVTHNPAPPVELPSAYTVAETGGSAQPERWWLDFSDAQLNALVQRALRDNLQLRASWARIEQARALLRQAESGMWPQVDLSASAARQSSRFFLGDQVIENTANSYSASIGAAYEIDLWQRIASQGNAAALSALAARDDYEAAAMSMAAEVAEAWFDLVSYNAQLTLVSEQLETNETYLELVELRFQKGLASALDVYQQRQQQVSTRAQITLLESSLGLLRNRLAVLLGQAPGSLAIEPPETLPETLPPLPARGLPADLLERRPDVRAAQRRVEAADYQVAAAVAARLPSLRISGSYGYQAQTLGDFLSSPVWSLVASVAQSIFDGGRRAAEVERTRAVVEEALMGYGQVLLLAMAEVENAIVQEQYQLTYIEELAEAVELADATLREARARYSQGLADYLPVLTALQALQRSQVSLLQAQRQLISYRIQMNRALGGTWTRELSDPDEAAEDTQEQPSDDVQAGDPGEGTGSI
ncbi:efflux transporter outer membrane subunit [Haliangium ochraceum]|uniref:RND efflux system, outer membrane lipoprotein, NodT family n=1 Tax=Haliangium ochraceum (strain DSM 14365 / JCM 11303 / SMP-2) TaxID=502025 RepID=D0LNZ0_HALO1|nr:efflux transporter outer membrane subunit [Haliangium ochraceum]ACY18816.1 RND efflux system, outer membrane lipoprotein, NodT family [Haliangium ochraceum DSM 14365]